MPFQVLRRASILLLLSSFSTFIIAQKQLSQVDLTLDSIFGHYNIGEKPGVSIAILEKGKPPFLKSYGHANLEYQIKNTPKTLFNATDLAKQFTVFSILLLQNQGKLSTYDNINKYLPQLKYFPLDITLKHLMEQTSGLRDVVELKKWRGYQNGDVVTKQDILDLIKNQRNLNFPPGSKFEYNRTGFVLLTEVIAKVSGMPFSTFVEKHIFSPLGMTNSLFVNDHTDLIKNRSYSYAMKDNNYTKIINNSSFVGGTNLYTSATDYSKWLINMSNQKIGKPSFYTYLQTKITLSNGEQSNYTPGIFKDHSEGYWTIHLEGFDHGYTSYMMYVPEYDFSLAFFSNDDDFDISEAYKAIYGWFNRDYKVPSAKNKLLQKVEFDTISTATLQNYTGTYLFEDNFSLREIVLTKDTLFYVRGKNNRTAMVPISGNHHFKMLVPHNDRVRVTFKNQGDFLEFRSLSTGKDKDYVTHGRKIKFYKEKTTDLSGNFKNEALNHTVKIQTIKKEIQLSMDDTSTVLDQIGDIEFFPRSNARVKHIKLNKDKQGDIIGIYLSGFQLKDLYYQKVKN